MTSLAPVLVNTVLQDQNQNQTKYLLENAYKFQGNILNPKSNCILPANKRENYLLMSIFALLLL